MKYTTYELAVNQFRDCSNAMLKEIVEQMHKTQLEEDVIVRKLIKEIYGKVDIIHIQIMGLMPALLFVMAERLND